MHAVLRTYSGKGAKELVDLLEKRSADVTQVISSVKGFISYSLIRTPEGGVSVSIYNDKAGADESVRKARDWVSQNGRDIGAAAPSVSEGAVVIHAG